MTQGTGVLVIAEQSGGTLEPVSLEVITAARGLADAIGCSVTVCAIGDRLDDVSRQLASSAGVEEVVTVQDTRLAQFNGPAWATVVANVVEHLDAAVVLAPGTTSGRDYLPRVAARLRCGHAADVVDVSLLDGKVVATRPVLESRALCSVAFEGNGRATMTVRPGALKRASATDGNAPVRSLDVELDEADFRLVFGAPDGENKGTKALDTAERIVAGGRGVGSPDRFSLIEELAAELHAAVAITRPLSDAGWRPHSDQIGQTGAHVSPNLYLAVGISGAVQHLVGVQNADYIVAINRDPNAPIFEIASFGIVGDLFEVVPAVIAELRATSA